VLRHERDTELSRSCRRHSVLNSVEAKSSAIWLKQTGQNMDESRFSSAISADQAMDLSSLEPYGHPVQCYNPRERLANILRFKQPTLAHSA